MLHDPKRDLTLANFAAWLETKDPKEEFLPATKVGNAATGDRQGPDQFLKMRT